VIQEHIKKYWEEFKEYMAELVDKIAEKVWWKINLMSSKEWIGIDKTKMLSKQIEKPVLDTLNPTWWIFVDYTPEVRASAKLWKNITTLDKTMKVSWDTKITIYRWTSNKDIVPWDFITTNKQLAQDYAGKWKVISKEVFAKDILDDITEPLWEEYIYRPKTNLLPTNSKQVSKSDDLVENVWKYTDWFKEWKLFDISPQSKSKISKMEIKADMWEITKSEIDNLNKWFKDNKDNYIKLYHWTSPDWKILDEWLKATTNKSKKSIQSQPWFVYLSFDPSRAKLFWEMWYAWKTPKVYEVKVKIWDLKPDLDQIWNKRYWWENQNIWDTLADSLLYGKWFRVKWNIEPYKISEYEQANKPKPLKKTN
jgi:hypothetical protein